MSDLNNLSLISFKNNRKWKMDERFFKLAENVVLNDWVTWGYSKVGYATSRLFIMEAILGKYCRILMIYLIKPIKWNSQIYSIFCFAHNFRVWNMMIWETFTTATSFNNSLQWSNLFAWRIIPIVFVSSGFIAAYFF